MGFPFRTSKINKAEYLAIKSVWENFGGYVYHDTKNGWDKVEKLDGKRTDFEHVTLTLDVDMKEMLSGCHDDSSKQELSATDFIGKIIEHKLNKSRFFTLKLNKEYSAEYIKGNKVVKVGCQDIPVNVIRELIDKIDSLNKE